MKIIQKALLFISILLSFVNMQCDDDSLDSSPICNQFVVVNESLYNNLVSENFTLLNAFISDDCLIIKMGASGCNTNSWEFDLADSGAVAESSPEQRYLKFKLINEEACSAYFERVVSFDISSLKIEGSHEIILNIEGFESSLTYTY